MPRRVIFACALLVALAMTLSATAPRALAEDLPLLVKPVVNGKSSFVPVGRTFTAEAVSDAGNPAARLIWKPGSKPMMEVALHPAPTLKAFADKVELVVEINTDGYPGLKTAGLRILDANNETFQFGGLSVPAGTGWKTWRIKLYPYKNKEHWGGLDAGKGEIDPPVKLASLLFKAPDDTVAAEKSILLRNIYRNALDPNAVEPEAALRPIRVELKTALAPNVIRPGQEDQAGFVLTNPENEKTVTFDFHVAFKGVAGPEPKLQRKAITLEAGQSVRVPLDKTLTRTGWYQALPSLQLPDGKSSAAKPPIALAYMEPAGTRPLPPADGFWFGIDARLRDTDDAWAARACAQIGADYIRAGRVWTSIQPDSADQYSWDEHLAALKLVQDAGLKVQYGLCFTPTWAARPEYVEKARQAAASKVEKLKPGKRAVQGVTDKAMESALTRTPPRIDAWQTFASAVATKNKGLGVIAYEIWNEPDLQGFFAGTTDEFLEMQRTAYAAIKAADPNALVLSGGVATLGVHHGHSLNPDLTTRMFLEAQDSYDAMCIHQHGDFRSFQQGIDGPLAEIRKQLQKDKPLFFTETGLAAGKDNWAAQGDAVVKKITFARARGAIGFSWFILEARNAHMNAYGMLDASRNHEPRPAYCAYNELVKMMRGTQYVSQPDVGEGNWVLAFKGQGQAVLVGWDESSTTSDTRVLVRLPANAKAEFVDIMGNATPAQPHEGIVTWQLGKRPMYLRTAGAMPTVLGPLAAIDGQPYGEPGAKVALSAALQNPLAHDAQYQITFTAPDGTQRKETVAVPAGQIVKKSLEFVMPLAQDPKNAPAVALAYSLQGTPWSGRAQMALAATRLIPAGDIDKREPDFATTEKDVFNANQNDPTREAYTWKGPEDLSAKVWLSAGPDHLTLKVLVSDDKHLQPNTAEAAWKADSIQFVLGVPGLDNLWEFILARGDNGQNLAAAPAAPVGLSTAYASKITLTTTPVKNGMLYVAKLPYEGLGVDAHFLKTKAIRFNLLVNDEDGGGREGFVFLAPGLGLGKKTPDKWPLLRFE